jgi:hypothetical protein
VRALGSHVVRWSPRWRPKRGSDRTRARSVPGRPSLYNSCRAGDPVDRAMRPSSSRIGWMKLLVNPVVVARSHLVRPIAVLRGWTRIGVDQPSIHHPGHRCNDSPRIFSKSKCNAASVYRMPPSRGRVAMKEANDPHNRAVDQETLPSVRNISLIVNLAGERAFPLAMERQQASARLAPSPVGTSKFSAYSMPLECNVSSATLGRLSPQPRGRTMGTGRRC